MLIAYQQQTRRLLNDQNFVRFNDFDLVVYINQSRAQIALDTEALRFPATLATANGTQIYALSTLAITGSPPGVGDVALIRSAQRQTNTGYVRLEIRPWEWFNSYYIEQATAATGAPTIMAQQRLGAGAAGTLWFYPTPDNTYTIRLFPVCLPIDLVDDATVEALPKPWQDAVAYYAAGLAYMSVGDQQNANMMWQRYITFQRRANTQVTGTQLPENFPVFNPGVSGVENQGQRGPGASGGP